MMKKEHLGGDFDRSLEAEGILDEATAVAVKCVIAWQIEQESKEEGLTKVATTSNMDTNKPE
ncbi:hypothetical protein [Azovibrio restrictus]|uniref:hypothetical protein n=1 Tax=Azovibrio restrictus TaxID=146938 RepID=UPI000688E1D8|nr:hypothetical protein [Azovibrio restrictus]